MKYNDSSAYYNRIGDNNNDFPSEIRSTARIINKSTIENAHRITANNRTMAVDHDEMRISSKYRYNNVEYKDNSGDENKNTGYSNNKSNGSANSNRNNNGNGNGKVNGNNSSKNNGNNDKNIKDSGKDKNGRKKEYMTKMQRLLVSFLASAAFIGLFIVAHALLHFGTNIPSYNDLADYQPPTITRIFASKDMSLMAEYGNEQRIFIKIGNIPEIVIHAFLSAEDKNFFRHKGVDYMSIFRAAIQNFQNIRGNSGKLVGGSTITQQVAKLFFLSGEKKIRRKIIEAILSYRISQIYSKEQILELYLNKIFLGQGAYGISAAAAIYFNKDLSNLLPEEAALLASLPKAPSELNPFINYERAKERRNWVLYRMRKDGFISEESYKESIERPIILKRSIQRQEKKYFSYVSAVKRELIERYGAEALDTAGMVVLTNIDPRLQEIAQSTLNAHLIEYETRNHNAIPIGSLNITPEAIEKEKIKKNSLNKEDIKKNNLNKEEGIKISEIDIQLAKFHAPIATGFYYVGVINSINKGKYSILVRPHKDTKSKDSSGDSNVIKRFSDINNDNNNNNNNDDNDNDKKMAEKFRQRIRTVEYDGKPLFDIGNIVLLKCTTKPQRPLGPVDRSTYQFTTQESEGMQNDSYSNPEKHRDLEVENFNNKTSESAKFNEKESNAKYAKKQSDPSNAIPQYCTIKNAPKANGAIVIIENYTGKVLASIGGISSNIDLFNRAIQARRQPGSLFKTIVYLSALENGYTPNTILKDAPLSLMMGNGKLWTPKNLTNRFLGDISMTTAFARSANLATIRLVMSLGFEKILNTAHRLNLYQNISHKDTNLSMALGTSESNLLSFTSIFATIASSGLKIKPRYIDAILSHDGETIYSDATLKSIDYDNEFLNNATLTKDRLNANIIKDLHDQNLPHLYYSRKRIVDAEINSEMLGLLRSVVQIGSGYYAREIPYDTMLKTGTTNDSKDVWCIGSSEYFTIGIYLGYDTPKNMGKRATGTSLAVPVFVDLLKQIKNIGAKAIASRYDRYPIVENDNSISYLSLKRDDDTIKAKDDEQENIQEDESNLENESDTANKAEYDSEIQIIHQEKEGEINYKSSKAIGGKIADNGNISELRENSNNDDAEDKNNNNLDYNNNIDSNNEEEMDDDEDGQSNKYSKNTGEIEELNHDMGVESLEEIYNKIIN